MNRRESIPILIIRRPKHREVIHDSTQVGSNRKTAYWALTNMGPPPAQVSKAAYVCSEAGKDDLQYNPRSFLFSTRPARIKHAIVNK
jgi:hypothetical protein